MVIAENNPLVPLPESGYVLYSEIITGYEIHQHRVDIIVYILQ
jgi:hypothetical protein